MAFVLVYLLLAGLWGVGCWFLRDLAGDWALYAVLAVGFLLFFLLNKPATRAELLVLRTRSRDELAADFAGIDFSALHVAPADFLDAYADLGPFRQPATLVGDNMTVGTHGEGQVVLVDVRRQTGKNQELGPPTTVVLFPECSAETPDFQVVPLSHFDRAFHMQGLLFDTDAAPGEDPAALGEFTRQYKVTADFTQDEALRQVFTADVLTFLAKRPGWTVQMKDGQFLVYRDGLPTPLDERPALLHEALAIRDVLLQPASPKRIVVPAPNVTLDPRPIIGLIVLTAVTGAILGVFCGIIAGFVSIFFEDGGGMFHWLNEGILGGFSYGPVLMFVLPFVIVWLVRGLRAVGILKSPPADESAEQNPPR